MSMPQLPGLVAPKPVIKYDAVPDVVRLWVTCTGTGSRQVHAVEIPPKGRVTAMRLKEVAWEVCIDFGMVAEDPGEPAFTKFSLATENLTNYCTQSLTSSQIPSMKQPSVALVKSTHKLIVGSSPYTALFMSPHSGNDAVQWPIPRSPEGKFYLFLAGSSAFHPTHARSIYVTAVVEQLVIHDE